jgi:hypothetical protein
MGISTRHISSYERGLLHGFINVRHVYMFKPSTWCLTQLEAMSRVPTIRSLLSSCTYMLCMSAYADWCMCIA